MHEAYVALTEGTRPPQDFNSTLPVFIPKGGSLPGTEGCEGKASQSRPMTLSNSCQKLIAKAFGVALETIAMHITHLAQRGLVRGRKMFSNVLKAQVALADVVIQGMGPRALVLFDVAAAFPSAEWDWIWRCLEVMGIPTWPAAGLRATYDGTGMTIMFDGTVFDAMIVSVRRGIKQGCPASGTLWSLLFDPILRRLVFTLPSVGYSLTCFADDLATALGNVMLGLRA